MALWRGLPLRQPAPPNIEAKPLFNFGGTFRRGKPRHCALRQAAKDFAVSDLFMATVKPLNSRGIIRKTEFFRK